MIALLIIALVGSAFLVFRLVKKNRKPSINIDDVLFLDSDYQWKRRNNN